MKSKRAREAAEVTESPSDVQPLDAAGPTMKKRKRSDDNNDTTDETKPKKTKKKDKKSKDKKESRREKKDKRKDLQDLPEEDAADDDADTATAVEAEVKKEKKDKKTKTQKTAGKDTEVPAEKADETPSKKAKKEKKDKKQAQPVADAANGSAPQTNGDTAAENAQENGDAIDLDESTAGKPDRHIVFVGNLPFTATAASISAHFASLSPIAVRCLRERKEGAPPCRGIAFVEFGKVWHQRTCLDKFHHSVFDDGQSPARKINVELTAGGGGTTKQRKEKIRTKNQKLDENRAKRIQKEAEAKALASQNGTSKKPQQQQQQSIEDAIHPSRRGRVPDMR